MAERSKLVAEVEAKVTNPLDKTRGPVDFEARKLELKEAMPEKSMQDQVPPQPSFLSQHPSLNPFYQSEHALSAEKFLRNWKAGDMNLLRYFKDKSMNEEKSLRLSRRKNTQELEKKIYFKRLDIARERRWAGISEAKVEIRRVFEELKEAAYLRTRPRIEAAKIEEQEVRKETSAKHIRLMLEAREYKPGNMVVTSETSVNEVLGELPYRPPSQVLWAVGLIEANLKTPETIKALQKQTAYQAEIILSRRQAYTSFQEFLDPKQGKKIKASDAAALYPFLHERKLVDPGTKTQADGIAPIEKPTDNNVQLAKIEPAPESSEIRDSEPRKFEPLETQSRPSREYSDKKNPEKFAKAPDKIQDKKAS